MPETLLRTKLFVPPPRPNLVRRDRLVERLNQGIRRGAKLSLISAPAGFGKTTLLSEWLENVGSQPAIQGAPATRVAWLSLDEGDHDVTRFLIYSLAALSETDSEGTGLGQGGLAMLHAPQPPPAEVVLTSLINDIAATTGRIILVLDDYHLVDSSSIDSAVTFLIDHLPAPMHLVIATREDPDLPLARYRARDEVTEVRAAELRFTLGEAADFLNQRMELRLASEEIASLETRTEGWAAGLQLAALSIRGREDVSSFIEAFAGDNRYIVDYLVQEVLRRQPEEIRNFLLQTSILDRLSGPLCDAVTGREDGKAMLESLERGNLFVVPLDDNRQWYRYHHLFADVLGVYLSEEWPARVPQLHRRASEWYEHHGSPAAAIHHALASEDFERVATLAELTFQAMDSSFQTATWLGWVKQLPVELVRARPVLTTQYANAAWLAGDLEASEAYLRDAEKWLGPQGDMSARPESPASGMVVVEWEQFHALPATIALARSSLAQAKGDISGTVAYAELALRLTPEEDHMRRAQATVTLGFTQWMNGDLEAAKRALTDWIHSMQQAGNVVFAIASTFALADIIVAQGRLKEAVSVYQAGLRLASEHEEPAQPVVSHLYLGLAMLRHEMGDQEGASQHLQKASELGPLSTMPDWPTRWCLARAHLKQSEGDLPAALELLDEAQRLHVRISMPDIRPVEALKARVYIRQGRVRDALAWVRDQALSVDDELSYLREFEHITLARVLIAEYESNRAEPSVIQAVALLERLLKAAEDGRRIGSLIEILMLLAQARQALGEIPEAVASLIRALRLAEPEGYVGIFVDEGSSMFGLLSEAVKRGMMPDYAGRLLAAFPAAEPRRAERPGALPATAAQPLVEPLSERELEVLRLIAQGLSNRDIGQRLFLALNTVKGHNRRIFGKLQAQNRTEAVARARQLGLI